MNSGKWRTVALASGVCCLSIALVAPVQAQLARVAASQRTTEKKSGDAEWTGASTGASLRIADKFRTGKRSKADLKFRDGSLVRLGQLSYMELRGAKQMNLVRGQLLFIALKPGRVLAGAAAAEIKGSVAIVQYRNYKNSEARDNDVAEFFLYNGVMDVISNLRTVTLKPGEKATVFSDGRIEVGPAPPLKYFGGELHPDILRAPRKRPFLGSPEHQDWRDDPERIERDHNFPTLFAPGGIDNLEPLVFPDTPGDNGDDNPPQPPPQSPPPPPLIPLPRGGPIDGPLGFGETLTGTSSPTLSQRFGTTLFSKTYRFASNDNAGFQSTLKAADDAAQANELVPADAEDEMVLDATAAYAHLKEALFDTGKEQGGDIALVGAAASRGAYAYGARLHGYAARDKWFADAAYFPMRVYARFNGNNSPRENRSYSAISDLSLTYSDTWGEAQIGRQRFLSGPTQATLFGSLIRAGGREIMDAVRFAPEIGNNYSLEVAYLLDAFPQNLPYRVSGNQKGMFGRAATYQKFGNFGLNVLKYSDANVDDVVGATIDFALPIVRDKIEFYGEVGRDPFRRRLTTFGLSLPFLHEKTGWDVFFETAKLRGSRETEGVPTEYAVRAYKRLNSHLNLVAAVSHFSGRETKFLVGFSAGARTSR